MNRNSSNVGANAFITRLKQVCAFNRLNSIVVVIEYSENKFNKTKFDARIRKVFDCDGNDILWPEGLSRTIYAVTSNKYEESFKVYKFTANPLSMKPDEDAASMIKCDYVSGKYGFYNRYTWGDEKLVLEFVNENVQF